MAAFRPTPAARAACTLAALLATGLATAQEAQRIEITGSSIKRVDAETALPVQIVTRDDILRSGAANIEQLMQTISAASSSGGLVASSSSGATTGGISSLSLRGLTSLRTLVLINGRRIAPYGIGFTNDSVSVDVNSIPLAAVERVEVLKDGASAIYGSDAIAGVVNFILRKNYRATELALEAGQATRGDAKIKRGSIVWGKGDLASDGYNLMLVGTLQKEDALFGRDRNFASQGYNVEAGNSTSSGNTFPANIAALDGSFGSVNPTAATGCVAPYSQLEPGRGTVACRFDPASLVALVPATDKAGIFAAAKFALSNDLEAFVEASFTRNKQRVVIQPVPLSDQFTIPPNNPLANTPPYNDTSITAQPSSTVILTSASPYYPTLFVQGITGGPTPDVLVRYRAAVSGNRDLTDTSEAPRLTFGLRGVALGWDFDTAFLHSASKVTEQINDGYPVLSKILPLLNSGTVNFFGANTPAVDAQIRATNFLGEAFSVTSTLTSLGGKASRDVVALSAGPLALALGAEFRKEKYDFKPSTELLQGDLAGFGGNIAAVDRTRSVGSAFGEVSVPIVKGLDLDAAVRFDRYEGVGNSTTPKVSFRWQPASAVLVRGSIGKGFRAPSLADLYAPQTQGVSQTGLDDPLRCPTTGDGVKDCATQFGTVNGGNTTLTPEKSTNATLGIVFEPVKGASIGIDAFHVNLENTITQGLAQTFILANLDKYGSFVVRGPVDPATPTLPGPIISINQQNINLGQTKVAGVDIDARWRWPAGSLGRFTLAFNGTYFSKYDTQNPDGSFSPNVGNLDQSTAGGVIPRVKTYQSLSWLFGDWDSTLAYRYQSSYKDLPSNLTGVDRRVGAYELFDLQTTYAGFKGLRLTLGVRNLLDRDPPYSNQGFSFQSGYDPQYADPRGRFVYAGLSYTFQ